jgi:aryl-alcohol dehydrogenase-like predicted oxidoreductase
MENRLILGTANFLLGYGLLKSDVYARGGFIESILSTALRLGINRIDTAQTYGEAELIIGQIAPRLFHTITKIPKIEASSGYFGSEINVMVNDSMTRLNSDEIYGLLLHFPSQLLATEGREIYDELLRLKSEGKVKKIGCSVYDIQELESIIELYDIDLVQLPLNVFDELSNKGIEIHVRSVFLQGLLLMSPNSRPSWLNGHDTALIEWQDYLQETKLDPVEVCLNYVLKNQLISGVVVGVDAADQVVKLVDICHSKNSYIGFKPSKIDNCLVDPRLWKK